MKDFWHPRLFHKNSWFSVKKCPFWKKIELVCSKLNKVHENDNNSFSPKNAFWAIFPESATYCYVNLHSVGLVSFTENRILWFRWWWDVARIMPLFYAYFL